MKREKSERPKPKDCVILCSTEADQARPTKVRSKEEDQPRPTKVRPSALHVKSRVSQLVHYRWLLDADGAAFVHYGQGANTHTVMFTRTCTLCCYSARVLRKGAWALQLTLVAWFSSAEHGKRLCASAMSMQTCGAAFTQETLTAGRRQQRTAAAAARRP